MRIGLLGAALAVAMTGSAMTTAEAAGCLKGAAVGGVAGHYAHHHAVLGAIGGCMVGHHMASTAARRRADQAQPGSGQYNQQSSQYNQGSSQYNQGAATDQGGYH